MQDFSGKVAVITGAASGIGRALAEAAAQKGMNLVLADVEVPALEATAEALQATGVDILPVATDVSRAEAVEALAQQAYGAFGAVDLLVNNAGVAGGATLWDTTLEDYEWILGVNLLGVIHGIRSFLPRMLARTGESYVVNTASVAGLLPSPLNGAYQIAKRGVVALSETLYYELAMTEAKYPGRVGVSVLCPGWVNTRIVEATRNHPLGARMETYGGAIQEFINEARRLAAIGMDPAQVAGEVFAAIAERRFYILPHPAYAPLVEQWANDLAARGQIADLAAVAERANRAAAGSA